MVEFAFVLFVKQKEAWKSFAENCESGVANSDLSNRYKENDTTNALHTADAQMTISESLREAEEEATTNISFWSRKFSILRGVPFTTKIDLVALVLFFCSYLIFNLVYMIRARDLFYENK